MYIVGEKFIKAWWFCVFEKMPLTSRDASGGKKLIDDLCSFNNIQIQDVVWCENI